MTKTPILAALLLCACQTVTHSPQRGPALMVADRLTWSEPPTIVASGLQPNTPYTLTLERVSPWNTEATERSQTLYTSSSAGHIDTSAQVADGDDEPSAYLPIRTLDYIEEPLGDLAPGRLRVTLALDGATVAERVVGMGADMDTLVEEAFDGSFPGAFILKRADAAGPSPAVVYLGGSEGGDGSARNAAPDLAEQGYTVLGLPYYSPAWFGNTAKFPELPRNFDELPIDYLESAVEELRTRTDVDPDRILLYGVSKGAEYALLAGSLIPDASPGGGFCGIVANVPTDVVWEGWGRRSDTPYSSFSWRGEALDFVPYFNIGAGINPNDPYTLAQSHADGRAKNPGRDGPGRIRVEAIDEPVLITGGDKDTVWPSGPMARNIQATRDRAGLPTEAYIYPEGGHSVSGTPLRRGKLADTQARLETYPATMEFLARNAKRDDCRG